MPLCNYTENPLADLFLSAASKKSKELDRIDNLFNSYANGSIYQIDPEGIESLCNDMELDPTDVRVLMLAWKMKAEKQGYSSLGEWMIGLKDLRADSISKLRKALPTLEKEENQKCVDIETICQLLPIIMDFQFQAEVNLFLEYLKLTFPELSDYNPELAWPLLLDSFVDYVRETAIIVDYSHSS